MNHELFDPKPNDLKALENSKLFFTYNILSFENKISNTVTNKEKIANLLENLDKSFLEYFEDLFLKLQIVNCNIKCDIF